MRVRASTPVRWGIGLVSSLLVVFFFWLVDRWLEPVLTGYGGVQQIQDVNCSFGKEASEGGWQRCRLPHNWDEMRPDYAGDAWYRFTLPHVKTEPLAIWLAASMNAAVSVNGMPIGNGGRMHEPIARHWNDYLLFSIPLSVLHRGVNEVVIHVRGYANNSSGLSILYVGPGDELVRMHHALVFKSKLLTYGAFVAILLIGFLAVMTAIAGSSIASAYFAAGCLFSSLYILDTMLVNIPLPREIWEVAVHVSIVWSEIFFLLFVFRFLDIRFRLLIPGALVYGAVGALLLGLASSDIALLPTAAVWEGISLIVIVIVDAICFRRWLEKGESIDLISGLALLAVIVSFAHDWLPWVLGMGVAPPFIFYLGPIGFAIMMSALMITRVVTAYHHEKQFSRKLNRKLVEQEKVMSREHGSMIGLWEESVVRDERDRIIRDLHDGLGGLLANAISHPDAASPHIQGQLKRSLGELRMVMSGLDDAADVSTLMAALRDGLQAEADEYGIELKWWIEDFPPAIEGDLAAGMQLVRIVQEAVHNAMRHGKPAEIAVHIDQSHCWISDNGCGFDAQLIHSGRGLKNLRWRAGQLNTNFDIYSNASGTKISMFWKK